MVAARKRFGPAYQLTALASALEAVDLRSPEFGSGSLETRDRLVRTIRSYLVPRLSSPATPLTVVFAGPTGSGKSTLINSLSGHLVSKTGPIRPTTTGPVVLARESAAPDYSNIGGIPCEVMGGRAPILDEMVLVDTPDIDSTATDHRAMAEILMDNADVVVFITSALRYADLVPWEVLRRTVSRGTPVLQILNRVTPESGAALSDFRRRLTEAGLADDVIRVPEHHLAAGSHAVPSLAVAGLRRRLFGLADDRDRHQREVVDRVLKSTLQQARTLVAEIDSAVAVSEIEEARIEEVFAPAPDLNGLGAPLPVSPPGRVGRFGRWRWLRRNRVHSDDLALFISKVGEEVHASVERDIGLRARSVPLLEEIAAAVARETSPVIESAVEGWIGRVADHAANLPERERGLATMALISATLGGSGAADAAQVLWRDGDAPVEKTTSDLKAHLEVPYAHAANLGAERVASIHGAPASAEVVGRMAEMVVAHEANA